MRQGTWEDIFRQTREEDKAKPSLFARLRWVSWEEVITLAIVLVGFLTVVRSIDNADWVAEMPSLYTIGFVGLITGLLLAHIRYLAGLIAHLTALIVGLVSIAVVVSSKLDGKFYDRVWDIADRLWVWGHALVNGGISNDNLPFVVLVVASTYIAAYLAAWSVFRWNNAWLAVVPGGLALLTNISYLPGQRSIPLLIYLFCSILLVARMNLLRRVQQWKATNTRYPDFISLHVLNVTVWVGLGLLGLAWLMPVGHGSSTFNSIWVELTSPIAAPMHDLGRVFSAVDSKKGTTVHQFGSVLPLQGGITLGNGDVMKVTTSEPGFLRAQSYDVYTPQGWLVGSKSQITNGTWPALKAMASADEVTKELRHAVSIEVTTSSKVGVIFSEGQPLDVNIATRVVFGAVPGDVASIRPESHLDQGAQYRVDGSVSSASENNLRSAPTTYPQGIEPYLQLPAGLPPTIAAKANEVTAGATNPYDIASKIEEYLRTFPIDMKIPAAPPKEDSVAYFLFDAKRGYFDYHASAMVVMLRTLGIPARLAVGYVVKPEDRSPSSSSYTITEQDAFAWPEVYFPGLGWIEFNPTPSQPPVLRSGVDGDFFPGFDPNDQFLDDSFFPPSDANPSLGPAAPVLDTFTQDHNSTIVSRLVLTIILVVLAATALVFLIFQYSWQHGVRHYAYPVQIWEKTLRLGRWTRIKPLPQETPREVVARLKRALPEIDDIDYIGESYVKTRYGHKELTPEEKDRLTKVWQRVRNTLLARLTRWH
ncbi:MAG TPA: transglutaminase domain-containing protein [Dehalococcoidia bacterium]|nr:transglutaminase domain-containing protein [Dehalococcoidia bacterium]